MKQQGAEKVIHHLLIDLKACIVKRDLQWGRKIHEKAVQSRNELSLYFVTTLIRMYGKCGSMMDARRVFDSIDKPDVVSWNVLLLGYAENGEGLSALELFSRMKERRCAPDSVTYVAAVKACTCLALNGDGKCLEWGREIHSEVCCHFNHYVQNALIDMYAKCGSMVEARYVFESMQPDVVCWTTLIMGYAENGEGLISLQIFSRMKELNCVPNSVTYVAALKACTSLAVNGNDHEKEKWLEQGRMIHSQIDSSLNPYLHSSLINMYVKCGSMVEARWVFDSIPNPNVVSWNNLLLGYAETGEGLAALKLFSMMKRSGCEPNSITYVCALKACTSVAVNKDANRESLKWGREMHLEIGCHLNFYVQNTLVDMYAKCGSMSEARLVFDSIQKPQVMCWTALIQGYAENREGLAALEMFSRMKTLGLEPDSVAYIAAIKACTSLAVDVDGNAKADCFERGRQLHLEIGFHLNHYVKNTLVDMYGKCGFMAESRRVFDSIQKPDVVSWNALLLGYADNGDGVGTLELFSKMKASACVPNSVTFIASLKACGSLGDLDLGRKFHLELKEFTPRVVTCLVDFYAKCGSMVEARQVFDSHSRARDVSTWNALLAGYSLLDCVSVFNLFERMQQDEGLQPDAVTFVCVLLCCSHAGLVQKAKDIVEAMPVQYEVTPSVIHYNCIIDALARANQLTEAIDLLQKMPCNPNAETWMLLFDAKNIETRS